MADVVSPEVRSRMMAGIRGTDTKPELLLRRGLHRAGFRFRLHDRALPGKPDMVFPRRRAVLFAHGCFWHGHNCHLFKWPKTREEFWKTKIARNREVDARTDAALKGLGWRRGVVWECALRGKSRMPVEDLFERLAGWLVSDRQTIELPSRKRGGK
jgi:DNA mismatch endonuclease, patch repair protein